MNNVLDLTKQLISIPSITPEDAGCQEILIERLEKIGFKVTRLPFNKVSNFWARRGEQQPLLVFAGHTDVVTSGPLEQWTSDPFKPEIRDDYLYGRGAADMKSSVAAMLIACEQFIAKHPKHQGSIGFLITSGEDGNDFLDGTPIVMNYLAEQNETIDWCLIGEPSSHEKLGDTIRNGRRGSINGHLIVHGKQGHVAYPQMAKNPIHLVAPALLELSNTLWDQGNDYFPPSSFQITNLHAGKGARNVIPAQCEVVFNCRYSSELHYEDIKQRVTEIVDKHHLDYTLNWALSGEPFITQSDNKLIHACQQAIKTVTGVEAALSTGGGTSDGRFIAPSGAAVIEFGPSNETIHQIDERVKVSDLEKLVAIYEQVLHLLLIQEK